MSEYIDLSWEEKRAEAEKMAEKIFGTDIKALAKIREGIQASHGYSYYSSQRIFGKDRFSSIEYKARHAVDVDSVSTLAEKCIKRNANIEELNQLCEDKKLYTGASNASRRELISRFVMLWNVIKYQVIDFETFWSMDYRIATEKVHASLGESPIYQYMKRICDIYLANTQQFDNILNQYLDKEAEKKAKNEIFNK